jgi:hypothetical protein
MPRDIKDISAECVYVPVESGELKEPFLQVTIVQEFFFLDGFFLS